MGQARDRRPDALGDFCAFPDEILCDIIASLPHRTVGTLACVSSVFYVLCNEEPLWMHLCLDEHRGGYLYYEGSWRKSALVRLGFIKKETTLKLPVRFDGFNSMFLYKRWYRCHVALQSFALDSGVIERRTNLSSEEFRATYDGKKPVLITDLSKDWRAQNTWNWPQLVDKYGNVAFKVSQSHGKKIKMKLKDYASYMAYQHDEEPLYIFDAKFGEAAPEMLEEYSVPPLFSEDLLSVLDKPVRPSYRWLVAGPARSGASWHVDPALTSAWNTLLSGRKRWALYPPGRVPPSVAVHVDEEDGSVHFDGPTSLQLVCLDMAPGFHHRGIARAGHLAIQECLQRATVSITGSRGFLPKSVAAAQGNPLGARGNGLQDEDFGHYIIVPNDYGLYVDVDNLATHTEKQSNHFVSSTSKGGYLDRNELRGWLRRLWQLRPDLHKRLWKCACISVDAGSWLQRVTAVCKAHGLPVPVDEEQLPVGSGSNPVYVVGDFVIKLCVEEDGPWVAIDGLRSEGDSSLRDTTPSLVASGIVLPEGEGYKVLPWDGSGECPGVNDPQCIGKKRQRDNSESDKSRYMTKWTDTESARVPFDDNDDYGRPGNPGAHDDISRRNEEENAIFWPYIVQKRCEGTNLDRVMDKMTKEDYVALASFLGKQLRLLHSLPLPNRLSRTIWTQKSTKLRGRGFTNNMNTSGTVGLCTVANSFATRQYMPGDEEPAAVRTEENVETGCCNSLLKGIDLDVPKEWQYFVGLLRQQRANCIERFTDWGSLPSNLQQQLELYLPEDPAVLVGLQKVDSRLTQSARPPVWLHMDVMADNIQMTSYSGDDHVLGLVDLDQVTCGSNVTRKSRELQARFILDFGDVSHGDPLYEFLAIHISAFKLDPLLLKVALAAYGLPLTIPKATISGADRVLPASTLGRDYTRPSYRAMCYCLLHEHDAMGAILRERKDCKNAASLEEVEEILWGVLNEWNPEAP